VSELTFSLVSNKIGLYYLYFLMKRTYQPKKRRRSRRHGFLKRMREATGQNVIKRRRRQGRKKLTTV
jgi:large subunit ribosomal protein L34